MLAAMLRQSTGGGGSGGSGGGSRGVGGNKLTLGIPRLSSSSLGSGGPSRLIKSNSVSSDNQDVAPADPNYIMQLVSDVRKFADVLLQLKEVFNSKETYGEGRLFLLAQLRSRRLSMSVTL
ncbi:hypothetical protein ATANTOWER_028160 [Ataeniobius toweri]|uniref:Uncharacterized protein n=1 Tax=Ataeniobius toweri TaxID=208326 RepID=A0ABU7AW18_9TELE|nr:hypothetical protein [Ataeniobius toweri]